MSVVSNSLAINHPTEMICSSKGLAGLQIYIIFMPPLKKGAYCFATVGRSVGRSVGMSVGMSVGLSVCRPSVVRSISFDPFT